MEILQGLVLMTGTTSLVMYDLFDETGNPISTFAHIEEGKINVAKFFLKDFVVAGGFKTLKFIATDGLTCEIPVANNIFDLHPHASLTLTANEEVMRLQLNREFFTPGLVCRVLA